MYNLYQYISIEDIKIFTNIYLGAIAILGNIKATICEKTNADIGIMMDGITSNEWLKYLHFSHDAIGGHV